MHGLQAPSSFLQAEGFKPPRSPLQRWRLQAPFKPPWSPLEAFRRWSPLRPSDLRPPVQQTFAHGRTAYSHLSGCWKQNLVIFFIFVRVYSLATGMEWVSSRTLFEPSGSKEAGTMTFYLFLVLVLWQLYKYYWTPALRSFIHVDVGEPTRHPCSMTGMMQDHHLLQLRVTWDIYLRELLCHREEVLSGMRFLSSEA